MRIVYEKGAVRAAAWQTFANYGGRQTVSSVDAGVIEFGSAAQAQAMFGDFANRWKSCEGTTVTTYLHNSDNAELYEKITDVRVDGAVLSATVINSDNQRDAQFPTERALGVAADCIVDVDAAVTGGTPAAEARRARGEPGHGDARPGQPGPLTRSRKTRAGGVRPRLSHTPNRRQPRRRGWA